MEALAIFASFSVWNFHEKSCFKIFTSSLSHVFIDVLIDYRFWVLSKTDMQKLELFFKKSESKEK